MFTKLLTSKAVPISLTTEQITKLDLCRMIGQSKISSFFSPVQQKRTLSDEPNDKAEIKKVKTDDHKSKVDNEENIPCTPPDKPTTPVKVSLSPEQKMQINDNKCKAKMKLMEKTTHGLVTNVGLSWFQALETEFNKEYFMKLSQFVDRERAKHTIYPPAQQVFAWTQMTDIKQVKVVILGQDPYHGPNQAHGLCFSVQNGVPPPPSLVNMYKELENDIDGFKHPGHGNLTGWAKQGVLLLNACLTVRAHSANSHKDQGWETFTDAVIKWLNKNSSGIVFMLWGSYAQKKGACIDKKKHHILKAVHPSPLSAHRGFFGCKHFSQANKLLKEQGKKTIDWKQLPV